MAIRFNQMVKLLTIGLFFVFLVIAQKAEGAYVYFATAVKDATVADAENVLGPPDNDYTEFSDGASATYYQFTHSENYNTASLSAALGISENALQNADFMAFDLNNGGGGFETSTWTFIDGVSSVTVNHTYSNPPSGLIMRNSDMSLADFNNLFGSNISGQSDDVGYLLFDLSGIAIDLFSPDFEVQITGGAGYPGTNAPDIVGMGTVVVPIPGAAWLLGAGMLGLIARRRQQKN